MKEPRPSKIATRIDARIEKIIATLERLYPHPVAPLIHKDPFTLLVSVVLSAQTTDKKVNEVTPALFSVADTPKKLAELPIPQIHHFIRQLGLAPQKAKALSGLAKLLVEEFGGVVPRDRESLERLPGVGRKTASVVLSQAFQIAAFPVDTHIHRLAHRWGLSKAKNVRVVEEDLKKVFPESSWAKVHLQIIFYGRQFCGARQCDGTRCEICAWCRSEDAALRLARSRRGASRGRGAARKALSSGRSGKRKRS
jgi:endonuclease III